MVDSRESRDGATIRRRRECLECHRRFTSYEQIEAIPYLVVKTDGRREEFNRGKLLGGLLRACEKRPVPAKRQEEIVDEIERKLHLKEEREISTREIGATVMQRLRGLDPVAYVRFASVYRRFEDIGAFVEEVQSFLNQPESRIEAKDIQQASEPRDITDGASESEAEGPPPADPSS